MKKIVPALSLGLALLLAAAPVHAAASKLSIMDLRACTRAPSPTVQIDGCTKVIASGKVPAANLHQVYAVRGSAYFRKRDFDKAIADFTKSIALKATPEAYFQRGMVYIAKADGAKAKADLAQAIALNPKFAPPYMFRGLIFFKEKDYAAALIDFTKAVELQPTYIEALYARGVAKKKTGDEAGGAADIKDAESRRQGVSQRLAQLGITP